MLWIGVCLLFSQVAALAPQWQLVWYDEFDGPSINISNWELWNQPGYIQSNGELEYYSPNNVNVSNGTLIITSVNQTYVYQSTTYNYTSGYIDTSTKFNHTFGRWEIRAQLPRGKGLWPAHWMVSSTLCWPLGHEFDIMENLGNDMSTIYGTVHFGNCCGCNYQLGQSLTVNGTDLSQDYHIYAFEWNATHLLWYLDSVNYHTVIGGEQGYGEVDTTPHFFIINTAVGGFWGGYPDNSTVFPQYHYVDYVRVYDWNPNITSTTGSPSVATTSSASTGVSTTSPATCLQTCEAHSHCVLGDCVCDSGYDTSYQGCTITESNNRSDSSILIVCLMQWSAIAILFVMLFNGK